MISSIVKSGQCTVYGCLSKVEWILSLAQPVHFSSFLRPRDHVSLMQQITLQNGNLIGIIFFTSRWWEEKEWPKIKRRARKTTAKGIFTKLRGKSRRFLRDSFRPKEERSWNETEIWARRDCWQKTWREREETWQNTISNESWQVLAQTFQISNIKFWIK